MHNEYSWNYFGKNVSLTDMSNDLLITDYDKHKHSHTFTNSGLSRFTRIQVMEENV